MSVHPVITTVSPGWALTHNWIIAQRVRRVKLAGFSYFSSVRMSVKVVINVTTVWFEAELY